MGEAAYALVGAVTLTAAQEAIIRDLAGQMALVALHQLSPVDINAIQEHYLRRHLAKRAKPGRRRGDLPPVTARRFGVSGQVIGAAPSVPALTGRWRMHVPREAARGV